LEVDKAKSTPSIDVNCNQPISYLTQHEQTLTMSKEKSDKKEKKEKKEKRSDTEGVTKKSKKDKKEKKEKSAEQVEALLEQAVEGKASKAKKEKKEAEPAKDDEEGDDVEMEEKPSSIIPKEALVPFCNPLADEKQTKKVLKSVRKGKFLYFYLLAPAILMTP
jgi:H/ACA ribonucleoprotein complex subunit 2